jgi:tetratricopeptide (TPR) repeat protein
MGTRRNKKEQRSESTLDNALVRVRRLLDQGKAKDALKEAKLCFRQDASPTCRQLLEEAYLSRVQQLYTMRQFADAIAVLKQLVEFRPTTPEVCEQIPRLRASLGMDGDQGTKLLAEDPTFLAGLADELVLDFNRTMPAHPELMSLAQKIRQALVAVEKQDDEAAIALMKDIPRQSPLSEWKLFVRGLIAFYQRDGGRTDENWRRLDPSRPAWRIARALQLASGETAGADDVRGASGEIVPAVQSAVDRLERRLQTDPAVDSLQQMATHWQNNRWDDYFREYRKLLARFNGSHASLIESIVDMTWKRAVREADERLLERLTKVGPAPPMDPQWNRARALLVDSFEGRGNDSSEFWEGYAEDVWKLPALAEDERPVAAGLIHLHLARRYRLWAEEEGELSFPYSADDDLVDRFETEALRHYRKAIECCKQLIDAYRELASLHKKRDEPARCTAVMRLLLAQQPDDYDTHISLAREYLARDGVEEAKPHVEAAARLKPRDPRIAQIRWDAAVTEVRQLAQKRRYEGARFALTRLMENPLPDTPGYLLHTLLAGVELKAKNSADAEEALTAALATEEEPAIVYLQMLLVVARYKLPADAKKRFNDAFKKEMGKAPTSRTAGNVARHLTMVRATHSDYSGLVTHERLALQYVKKIKKKDWAEHDLADACLFLDGLPRQMHQRWKLVEWGIERFPENAQLHLLAGQDEFDQGPMMCDRPKARYHLERALELASRPGTPQSERIIATAQRSLAIMGETRGMMDSGGAFEPEADFDDGPFGSADETYALEEALQIIMDTAIDQGVDRRELQRLLMATLPPDMREELEELARNEKSTVRDVLKDMIDAAYRRRKR